MIIIKHQMFHLTRK